VVIYYLLPLNRSSTWVAVTMLVIGLALFIGLVAFQVRSIVRSRFPGPAGHRSPRHQRSAVLAAVRQRLRRPVHDFRQ
jgi:hypothetical protein